MPEAPTRSLTPEELEAYDRDGVICARGLFSDDWLARMSAAVDRAVAHPTLMGNVVSMKDANFSGDLFLWKVDDERTNKVGELRDREALVVKLTEEIERLKKMIL